MIKTYEVVGMHCEHCKTAVEAEVSEVPGAQEVDADLASGKLRVSGENFTDAAVADAVEEAGYSLKETD